MSTPILLETIPAARAYRAAHRAPIVAFVPTMGALHEGHASLFAQARALAGKDGLVLASIFVNPTQFGPTEDFSRYPRTLDADLAILQKEGCDAAFIPTAQEMYPSDSSLSTQHSALSTSVDPGPLGAILEGTIRPTHFRGVCTVVAKLLHILTPTHMLMGQKDFQQQLILRRMTVDLNIPTEIITCPTIREPDGLALSSRNRYLTPEQRAQAVAISQALTWGVNEAAKGALPSALETGIALRIADAGLQPQYVAAAHRQTLQSLPAIIPGNTVLLVAAKCGTTRLIDNMLV